VGSVLIPPELDGNRCRLAPERARSSGHRIWIVSAPYGGSILRFKGEPTSLLYAVAPLVHEIRNGRLFDLAMSEVALMNPTVASPELYQELEQRLHQQPDLRVVCISALTAGSVEARRIATLVKSIRPNAVTIFGGPHEDDIDRKTATDPTLGECIDFSVAGEGEYALLELVRVILENPQASPDEIKSIVATMDDRFRGCHGRSGVYFRDRGQTHGLMLDGRSLALDSLPIMPRELVHENDTRTFAVFRQAGWNKKTAQVMTHRGCAWRCTFCSESASLNTRSVQSVIAELDHLRRFAEMPSGLERDDYGAVFFDDSTFTTRSRVRRTFLASLFDYLRSADIEWGCQTRLDQIDVEVLQAMKDAGCTYVYVGLESASDQMLRAMIKDQNRAEIEKAFDAIDRVGIRVGLSLIFGVAEPGLDRTSETKASIRDTLDFVERRIQAGNIVYVSPNIATYYPGTKMSATSGRSIDFRNPIVNTGFPWNRFEEGESYHPKGIDADLATFIVDEATRRFGEFLVDQDLYTVPEFQEAHRKGALEAAGIPIVDLNAASIAQPSPPARAAAAEVARLTHPRTDFARRVTENARSVSARLMGLAEHGEANVLLTRNATESVALAHSLVRHWHEGPLSIVATNAEYASVLRACQFSMDHANRTGRDLWTSFQDYGALQATSESAKSPTGTTLTLVDAFERTSPLATRLTDAAAGHPTMFVLSHVVRDDGWIWPVQKICAAIRDVYPHAFILIDGAQALGGLPTVNVDRIDCDFYVAAPHKTLSALPLGLMWVSDRVLRALTSMPDRDRSASGISPGMLAPEIAPGDSLLSLPELAALVAAVQGLERDNLLIGSDFRGLDLKRSLLKEQALRGLLTIGGLKTRPSVDEHYSNFIASFSFEGIDNRAVVERLWRECGVFVSYIARSDRIRASFPSTVGTRDVQTFVDSLRRALGGLANDSRPHERPAEVIQRPVLGTQSRFVIPLRQR
jgi:radical SAM superfamily enzyme YgiQ (UPF0313 family)/selenocysteine lyase/cysteine desulfurase